jgi:hypothetical protein
VRRECRQPTRREWAQITSSRPVVRRAIRSGPLREAATPMAGEAPDATPGTQRDPIDVPLFGAELTNVSKASEGEKPSN